MRFRPHAPRGPSTQSAPGGRSGPRVLRELAVRTCCLETALELRHDAQRYDVRISGITSTKATEARRTAQVTHDDVTV